jgi:hypothetical protein
MIAGPQNIFSYFSENSRLVGDPWLVVGKGPSFAHRGEYDLTRYRILSLNDTVREGFLVNIAHFIDFDAFERCAEYLLTNSSALVVLPWFPHFKNRVGSICLRDLVKNNSVLSAINSLNRLFWYDLSTSCVRRGLYPVVSAKFFSSEAAIEMLAIAGVRVVRTLGIDGGKHYSREFSDLENISLLSNKQISFDGQFEAFPRIMRKYSVDIAPLGVNAPIKVFVGAGSGETLPFRVLSYSLRKFASVRVEVVNLAESGIPLPVPRNIDNRARTPFSFQRFLIPQICGYAGRAIYLDADMLVFKDISVLWRRSFGYAPVMCVEQIRRRAALQYSVLVMDCARLDWDIKKIIDKLDSGDISYSDLMFRFALSSVEASIEPTWNSLDFYKDGESALLHFTDMAIQPWVSRWNPHGYLWVRALRSAVDEGEISRDMVEEEISRGHVRPSLAYLIDRGLDNAVRLPRHVRDAEAKFVPPCRALAVGEKPSVVGRARKVWLAANYLWRTVVTQ